MSWREVMAGSTSIKPTYTQNPHNTHNSPNPGNSEDIAYCADIARGNSKLLAALAVATHRLPITAREVLDALAPEDIEEWRNNNVSTATLEAFAASLLQRREMEAGSVPAHYTKRATCRGCGPVWLWFAGEVLGCPWCWNRAKGLPVPCPPP